MTPAFIAGALFTLWMGIEAYRRGHRDWIWIILLFNVMGALIYFVVEYLGQHVPALALGGARRQGAEALRIAEEDVRRVDNAPAWADYALALRAMGKHHKAAEAGKTATERDPEDVHANFELGINLHALGKYSEATAPLEKVVAEEPYYDTGQALYCLADSLHRVGDLQAADARYEKLVERYTPANFTYGLASVKAELGDTESARSRLEQLLAEAEHIPKFKKREMMPWVREARKALKRLEAER